MIKDYKFLIELHHILIEQVLVKYVNRVIKQIKYKIINFDEYTNENKTQYNPKWPHIPDHRYRILILGGSGSGKTRMNIRKTSMNIRTIKNYLNPLKNERNGIISQV